MGLVIGVDYGTDSVRAVVVDTVNGQELGEGVHRYRRWARGDFCAPASNKYRQHPADYLEGLELSIRSALEKAPTGSGDKVEGIAVDTTGSTPVAIDKNGTPLALLPEFENDPDAMFILWKDHTSIREAAEINQKSNAWPGQNYLRYVGGIYSSEWFWAKVMHIVRNNSRVRAAAYTWIEHADWIPAVLSGITEADAIVRSRCAWGHKLMWNEAWDGLPPADYLAHLDPYLTRVRERSPNHTHTADVPVGTLCSEWAKKLGLRPGIAIGGGAFDCHMGAVGAGIQEGWMVKVIGTSTCDIMVSSPQNLGDKLISGICGQVDGSVIPGLIGLEAGQSAFGDLYAWFQKILLWPLQLSGTQEAERAELAATLIARLEDAAEQTPLSADGILALDWVNGRRTPDADQSLQGALMGLTMSSDAPRIFRALVEATAFGARAISNRFTQEGVPITGILAIGGVARKSRFVTQVLADVLEMPVKVCSSDQACALGASIFAAVAAGLHPDVPTAINAMACGVEQTYMPDPQRSAVYQKLYQRYLEAGQFEEQRVKAGIHHG